MRITSLQNQRIKDVVKLHQHRQRTRQGKFLIAGYRPLYYALEQGYELLELYVAPSLFFGENEERLIAQIARTGAAVFEVTDAIFAKLFDNGRPDGLLAVARQPLRRLVDEWPPRKGFYLIAEGVEKPGNLGTILRSADGAGASGVIVCDPCTDLWHPEVVRGSVGACFVVPCFEADRATTLAWCRQQGITILAATPQADQLYTEVDMTGLVALAVGTEQHGLSEHWLTEADHQIKLPMLGKANSLNVAVAATLLLYEVVRQRER